jgi:hypothetical protein
LSISAPWVRPLIVGFDDYQAWTPGHEKDHP